MRPVPSLVTPIPTPKKDQSFAFPTRQVSSLSNDYKPVGRYKVIITCIMGAFADSLNGKDKMTRLGHISCIAIFVLQTMSSCFRWI